MKVTRRSQFNGTVSTLELDITKEQLNRYENGGDHVQNVFPNLNQGEREFIMTGCTPEEWNELFGSRSRLNFKKKSE